MSDTITYRGDVTFKAVSKNKNRIIQKRHNDVHQSMLHVLCEALAYGNVVGKTPLYLDIVRTLDYDPDFDSQNVESILLNLNYPSLSVEYIEDLGGEVPKKGISRYTNGGGCKIEFSATVSEDMLTENVHTSEYYHYALLRSDTQYLAHIELDSDVLSILSETVNLKVYWSITLTARSQLLNLR